MQQIREISINNVNKKNKLTIKDLISQSSNCLFDFGMRLQESATQDHTKSDMSRHWLKYENDNFVYMSYIKNIADSSNVIFT